jgi:hypothetical protein
MAIEKNIKSKQSLFKIWEGIFPNFELAQKLAVHDGFSSERYIAQARKVATESLLAISESRNIPLFHKQRFTLLPITVTFLLGSKKKIQIMDLGGGLELVI